MGIEIGDRDRLFVAAVLPFAIAAGYWYGWRSDAYARLAAMETTCASMVSREDFDAEKTRAARALSAAARELEAERAAPQPKAEVAAGGETALADREKALLGVLREVGLGVKSGQTPEKGAGDASGAGEALSRAVSWRRGQTPVLRRYTLDGGYPSVKAALDVFVARRMGVIVEKIEMRDGGTGRWTLEVWL